MKLSSTSKSKYLLFSALALVVSLSIGFLAGNILKSKSQDTSATSTNITVSNNNQIISIDQSTTTQTITRTSKVTVKDSTAHWGYTLTAQLTNNPIPGSTIRIMSPSSTTCTASSFCALDTTTPTEIFSTIQNTATSSSGETTTWTIQITIPGGTALGNYPLDITYDMSAPTFDSMQDFTTAKCSALSSGTVLNLEDTRDHTVYRVKKMADNRCWMIDNLALDLNKTNTPDAPTFSPAAEHIVSDEYRTDTRAQYLGGYEEDNPIPNYNNPKAFYRYNWCATMGDTSANCATTLGYGAGQPTATTTGICPAPFRLPRGTMSASTNDFAILDIAMGGTGASRGNANTFNNWLNDGAGSKYWAGQFRATSNDYVWWSSTKYRNTPDQIANDFAIYPNHPVDGPRAIYIPTSTYISSNYSVRCLL